ncbi:MAG: DnaA regulatory inactivator Hda [Burkholderiales bacterium]|nr:DnaA regulatory inactivator Hda [Burkholderiales bacterium]
MRQIPLDLLRAEPASLDNFVVGRNAEVLATMRALQHAVPTPSVVYLWGEAGCGKTHLLASLAGEHAVLDPQSAPSAFAPEPLPPLTAVDDCDRLDDERQQRLFQLINRARAQPGAVVLAAGSQPPLALPLRDDLRTRLGSGLVYRLQLLADEEKADVLRRNAAARGVALSPEVIPYLISHTSRDIRALLRLFDALDRYALEQKRAITLPLLRQLETAGALVKSH